MFRSFMWALAIVLFVAFAATQLLSIDDAPEVTRPGVDLSAVPVTEGDTISNHQLVSIASAADFTFQSEPEIYSRDMISITARATVADPGMRTPDALAKVLDEDGDQITLCRTFKNPFWSNGNKTVLRFECPGNFSEEQKQAIDSVEVELGRVTY